MHAALLLFFHQKPNERLRLAGRWLATLALAGLPALALAQTASFPRNALFTGTDASGFTLGGSAYLTAAGSSPAGGTPPDAAGSGVLRLTDALTFQAGYAIDNSTFDARNGFSISFEFFSYGTTSNTPADGFSVFLVDGVGTAPGNGFSIGGTGGSLGYAYRHLDNSTNEPGVSRGYLGIGIDEFGNYGITSEGKIGGYPGQSAGTYLPNAVSLRGPYNSADATYQSGYAYLAGSGTLPFNLAVGTSPSNQGRRITDPTSTGYRKAYVNVNPITNNGAVVYKITVRIQNGQNVTTAINNVTVDNPPSTLRIGFAGSTGGNNGVHEIRQLSIVHAPIAVDDNTQTPYNQSVSTSVLANDVSGSGANIDPATVDLDPSTVARETSYTVPGQGTFTVDNSGLVTFTPLGSFAGTVSLPYTVQNQNQDLSNPGILTVVVMGADLATVVQGSGSVQPGQTTTLTVTTTNNGQETALDALPMLALPAGFSVAGPLPAGATATTSNGITTVTFAKTTLPVNQAVANELQVLVGSSTAPGTYSMASAYTYPSGAAIPDAVAGNNTSTLAMTVVQPLPVQLVKFTAVAASNDALLRWETAQELNSQRFDIERSLDGVTFTPLGALAGRGTTTQASTYRYVDAGASAQPAEALYYRLRQVDYNGAATFSPVQSVSFHAAPASVALYPNPATGATTLDLRPLPAGNYTVRVFEATGRLVHQATYQPGECRLPLGNLVAGTYFVRVQGTGFSKVLLLSQQ